MKRSQYRPLTRRAKKGDQTAVAAQSRLISVQEAQIRDLKQQITVLEILLIITAERMFDHIDPITGEVTRLQLTWPTGE